MTMPGRPYPGCARPRGEYPDHRRPPSAQDADQARPPESARAAPAGQHEPERGTVEPGCLHPCRGGSGRQVIATKAAHITMQNTAAARSARHTGPPGPRRGSAAPSPAANTAVLSALAAAAALIISGHRTYAAAPHSAFTVTAP